MYVLQYCDRTVKKVSKLLNLIYIYIFFYVTRRYKGLWTETFVHSSPYTRVYGEKCISGWKIHISHMKHRQLYVLPKCIIIFCISFLMLPMNFDQGLCPSGQTGYIPRAPQTTDSFIFLHRPMGEWAFLPWIWTYHCIYY